MKASELDKKFDDNKEDILEHFDTSAIKMINEEPKRVNIDFPSNSYHTKEQYLNIEYKLSPNITPSEFIEVLKKSTLGERRPIDDLKTIQGMIENADIIVSATIDNKIVGIARAVTDFHYCCYLSDLAVDERYQKNGIGKKLILKVQEQLNDNCKIILLSAPNATGYYPKIGFTQHNSAWTLGRLDKLK